MSTRLATHFTLSQMSCLPVSTSPQVKADLDLIKRLQKTRTDAPLLLEKQVTPSTPQRQASASAHAFRSPRRV